MCSKSFHSPAATVVCQQFGLKFHYFYNPVPGPSGGRIWLDNVQCNGNEHSIFDCTHNGWGNVTDCSHDDDVGISCTSMHNYCVLAIKSS